MGIVGLMFYSCAGLSIHMAFAERARHFCAIGLRGLQRFLWPATLPNPKENKERKKVLTCRDGKQYRFPKTPGPLLLAQSLSIWTSPSLAVVSSPSVCLACGTVTGAAKSHSGASTGKPQTLACQWAGRGELSHTSLPQRSETSGTVVPPPRLCHQPQERMAGGRGGSVARRCCHGPTGEKSLSR